MTTWPQGLSHCSFVAVCLSVTGLSPWSRSVYERRYAQSVIGCNGFPVRSCSRSQTRQPAVNTAAFSAAEGMA